MKPRTEFVFYLCVGVGMALATSVFTMISGLFEAAGAPWVVAGVLLAGAVCAIIALSIGELAAMFPSAPGIRTYLKAAFGDQPSLIVVYLYLIFVVLIAGLESFVFARVVDAVYPGVPPLAVVSGLLATVLAVNLAGLEVPRTFQMFTATLAIATLLASGLLGAATAPEGWSTLTADFDLAGSRVLPVVVGMSVFLFMGFEWITPLGLRPQSYQRRIPIAMLVAVGVLALTYSSFVVGLSSQLPREEIAGNPVPQIGYLNALYGAPGTYVALGLSICAISSTFNAGIMGGSRLVFALAREGRLPRFCGSVWLRTGAPAGAVVTLGGLASLSAVAVILFRWELQVAVIGAAIICLVYSAFLTAVLVLRRKRSTARRPYRTPVATPVQWCLVVLLPLIGLVTLLPQPQTGIQPAVGALACLVLSLALSWIWRPDVPPVTDGP